MIKRTDLGRRRRLDDLGQPRHHPASAGGVLVSRLIRSCWIARVCRTEFCFFTFGSTVEDRAGEVVIGSALAAGGAWHLLKILNL